MDANEFIVKLKANNTSNDINDLAKVSSEYNVILNQLPPKDRAPFSLNVLCILCRNLDKAPKWRNSVDCKQLLTLSIACVRETRGMERADRVKTLACIYHIHRHVVKQNTLLPPELVLKISFMPFEVDAKNLLNEYAKTYWNICVDRLTYIERLRTKIPIVKLLPKLTEDIVKIIEIYDTVQFCSGLIVFLVKKLHFLYNEKHAKELNDIFRQIFLSLSKKDTKPLKKLAENEIMDIYVKLNDCLYVIAENALKTNFKDNPLENIVRSCISIVGHNPGIFHCLQTFYSNSFCSLLTTNTHPSFNETILQGLIVSLETTEKLGYKKAMRATFPYLNQFLRLYIEFNVVHCTKKPWKDNFNTQMQENCLKLMMILMKQLTNCDQLLKCENCSVKSGLHDSLRLSFMVQHFITVPLSQNMSLTDLLPILEVIIENQYKILDDLRTLGCGNYQKFFRKLQTDIHNTAIGLNKGQYFEFSIKLFDIYLIHEIIQCTQELDHKNISRALYNKSICELDAKMYESAIIDAFLSLVYSNDGLNSEKYMSLVIDIKAKELKSKSDDDDEESKVETLQMFSVIKACEMAMEKGLYGNILSYLMELEFSELLKHEFAMYAKLWPSIAPIAGVWTSLHDLSKGKYKIAKHNGDTIWTLYEIILQTLSSVKNISSDHFKAVTQDLLANFDLQLATPDTMVVQASLLFLNAEFELAAASLKYGWKSDAVSGDPDQVPANRTVPQEYNAVKTAIQAVGILAELTNDFDTVSNKAMLRRSLQLYQVCVAQLLHLSRDIEALQLAITCCLIADCVADNESFVRNAGTLIYHARPGARAADLLQRAAVKCESLAGDTQTMETVLIFMCDAAMYYSRCGEVGNAARLVQLAQSKILNAYEQQPDMNLDLAVGRVLEAQAELCKHTGASVLSDVNGVHRHYLSVVNTGSNWHARRLYSLTVRYHTGRASLSAARAARRLRLWRRARSSAAVQSGAALVRARLYAEITDANSFDDAQITIDNRLKYYLGLQPSNETQPCYAATESKSEPPFTLKQDVEIMLENMVLRKCPSPSTQITSVPAFKKPDFFTHDKKCECYACLIPVCYILACQTSGLEASMYFRADEIVIARNYFNGVMKMFHYVEERFKSFANHCKVIYDDFVVDSVINTYWEMYRAVKIEILIEMAFFELNNRDFDVADEHIIEIHEILQESGIVDEYLNNEMLNLITCSAQSRKITRKPVETGLEAEFEELKLSPVEFAEPPKTPVTKPVKLKPVTKIIVKDEEVPKRRKVIKLNLDEGSSEETVKKTIKKPEFKVPEPVTSKHTLELATPRNRSKPSIIITQPSQDTGTPQTHNKTEFFTPKDATPERFFTPMTSVKTYAKKSLRHSIVKNLEQEFSTPTSTVISANNESLEVPKRGRVKKNTVKTSLKRATSPGKLCKEPRQLPRGRRLRDPVKLSNDEDDNR